MKRLFVSLLGTSKTFTCDEATCQEPATLILWNSYPEPECFTCDKHGKQAVREQKTPNYQEILAITNN